VSLYRPGEARFYLTDRLGSGAAGIGAAERTFAFGDPGDLPLAIDAEGDGIDEVAVHRPGTSTFYVRTPGGVRTIPFGDPGDVPLAGDWDGDGEETPGVYRASRARFLLGDGTGAAGVVLPYGDPAWTAVSGRLGLGGPGDGAGTLVVHAVGDVNLDPGYVPTLGWYGHDYAWSGLGSLFADDDLTIVNLECAPGPGGRAQPKTFVFRCDPDGIGVMAAAGVEVANLANNHSQDYGADAMVAGRAVVARAGIDPVGAGADLAEALRPAVVEFGGTTVAVLGFGGVIPARSWLATPDRPGMANGDDIALMTAAVGEAAAVADVVLVTLHWGIERDLTPRPDDVARGRALIDAGADAVFGHHPHRLQPMEMYRDRPIFWSLGNFVWTDHSPAGNVTAVAEVLIQPDGMITAHLIPARIVDDGLVVLVD
jgi:poly-gamma-glutamate synthesis protein (capsule biosynthesis protein)